MPPLASDLRRKLENVVIDARDLAGTAARAALKRLGVDAPKAFGHFSEKQKELRNRLRARARQAGDRRKPNGEQEIEQLTQELAYEYWHRMLFARFLAENHLLMHPDGVAVSLVECDELAKIEGAENGWVLAARYASRMLPQIFRTEAVLLEVEFPINDRLPLEKLLASLPSDTFTASDSLGWVYQFWQTQEKKRVNESEVKIGADELPAVTQLFTESYMVQFLLHNTLGAWWAGKRLKDDDGRMKAEWEKCQTEPDCRRLLALPGVNWEYLRFVKVEERPDSETSTFRLPPSAFLPAAGTFDGWPNTAAALKVLDPCCGSGHFLIAALRILVAIRMAEEGLSARDAVDAVLRDNLHGLEIDERCCQIAAFALALEAWKMTGYRELPALHIACTGIGPQATEDEWLKLAEQSGRPMPRGGREPIRNGLLNLHHLFSQAPTLGSLINPTELPADLIAADYETIQPYLSAILEAEKSDDETRERAIAAAGMVQAAELLAGEYTLVITNVPYLGRGKQDDVLKAHIEEHYAEGKADLATTFVLRCVEFCSKHGTAALVTPQNWLFLTTYTKLRESLLKSQTWNLVARLGPGAFETISGQVVNVAMLVLSASRPGEAATMAGIDVSAPRGQQPIRSAEKAALLRGFPAVEGLPGTGKGLPSTVAELPVTGGGFPRTVEGLPRTVEGLPGTVGGLPGTVGEPSEMAGKCVFQTKNGQNDAESGPNPQEEPRLGEIAVVPQAEQLKNPDARIVLSLLNHSTMIGDYAETAKGICSFDSPRFYYSFWELGSLSSAWLFSQGSVEAGRLFDGRSMVLRWEGGAGQLAELMARLKDGGYSSGAWRAGEQVWGRQGLLISLMSELPSTIYDGYGFDNNTSAIVPTQAQTLLPLFAFCTSPEFASSVRLLDQKMNVTSATLDKVAFDLAHWQRVAAEKYPDGLPEPESDDPTQWLFHGRPEESTAPLQVAVARLLGYRWPAELDDTGRVGRVCESHQSEGQDMVGLADSAHPTTPMRLSQRARALVQRCDELAKFADSDGIVCIPSVRGEEPAAERLQGVLRTSYDKKWSNAILHDLMTADECKPGTSLDDWLRTAFFEQHCKLFHNRPFIWHIWDGRKDGFSCLVNYHKLNYKTLENLTYAYLGDWIKAQAAAAKHGKPGADLRLAAAQELQNELKLILEGEPPYDIFVRWKPIHEQVIGWNPDLNDGVRVNIRPFVEAGVLRKEPNIGWSKDRGKEPERDADEFPWFWKNGEFTGERVNDYHLTNAQKRAAQKTAKAVK